MEVVIRGVSQQGLHLTILKARFSPDLFTTFRRSRFSVFFHSSRTFLIETSLFDVPAGIVLFLNKYYYNDYDTHFELNYRVTLSVSRPNRHTSHVELLIAVLLVAATRIPFTMILSVINRRPKIIRGLQSVNKHCVVDLNDAQMRSSRPDILTQI